VLLRGELARGEASRISGKPERTARRVISHLLERGLLTSETAKGPLQLGLPAQVAPYYFPHLYPAAIESELMEIRSVS